MVEETSPGPWEAVLFPAENPAHESYGINTVSTGDTVARVEQSDRFEGGGSLNPTTKDAVFIAEARTAVPYMLDALMRYEVMLTEVEATNAALIKKVNSFRKLASKIHAIPALPREGTSGGYVPPGNLPTKKFRALMWKLGFTHHSEVISGVMSFTAFPHTDGRTPDTSAFGTTVEGYVQMPGMDVDVITVEFKGRIVDPNDNTEDGE
jgi:hypothetical protein